MRALKRWFKVIIFEVRWQFIKDKDIHLTEQEEIYCTPMYLAIGGIK